VFLGFVDAVRNDGIVIAEITKNTLNKSTIEKPLPAPDLPPKRYPT
jgi:hypothetical protein